MFRRAIKRQRLLNKVPLNVDDETDPRFVLGCEDSPDSEHNLEKLVFGDSENLIDKFHTSFEPKRKEKPRPKVNDVDEIEEPVLKGRSAAWADEDDLEIVENDQSLKGKQKKKSFLEAKFNAIHGNPSWAQLDKIDPKSDISDDDEDDILQEADDYLSQSSETLPQGIISLKRVRDLNFNAGIAEKIFTAVEFHPSSTVALVAGKSGIATLFQVDGKTNPKIQSIKFKNFPISTAHFSANGEELIVGSYNCGVFYYYDMIAGKICKVPWEKDMGNKNMGEFKISPDNNIIAFHGTYGHIHLISAKSKEWIGSLKMNNNVRALAFNNDGSRLYAHGSGGEVYIFDMKTRDCVHKFYDDGCIKGTAICVSPDSNRIACGSDSGVVNIYETSKIWTTTPKPIKTFLNLTTQIHNLKINHSNEFVVMTSDVKDNAIKLAHMQSMSVFSNFPLSRLNMKKPLCIDVSLNSGYLAVGNNHGKVLLYRLKHYKSY